MFDDTLANEALSLADGADIHDIKTLVALYRKLDRPADVLTEIERELLLCCPEATRAGESAALSAEADECADKSVLS